MDRNNCLVKNNKFYEIHLWADKTIHLTLQFISFQPMPADFNSISYIFLLLQTDDVYFNVFMFLSAVAC